MADKYKDRRHNIPVVLDYRVAHTVIGGFKMSLATKGIVDPELNKWIQEIEDLLDKGVQGEWDGKCRRNGDRRGNK
jgi:hypothetical protein